MLRPPENQVAGHRAANGKLGPLVDSSLGRFYKPLQGDSRGAHEAAFYAALYSASTAIVPDSIRKFFPKFHGVVDLPASDGSGLLPHLALDDLLASFRYPSVADFKIGSRTWYPSASESYITKCLAKDRRTTSLTLGFRISGIKVHFDTSGSTTVWCPERELVLQYTVPDAKRALWQMVSTNPGECDAVLAAMVYGGKGGVLEQLRELKAWFEEQTMFHFYSASVLLAFEKGGDKPMVRLVDFAHVVDGNGVIDHNFLGGLCSLIKCISEVLDGITVEKLVGKMCFQSNSDCVRKVKMMT